MLQDFYMVELYFGNVESAQSFEKLIEKYGSKAVIKNMAEGLLDSAYTGCQKSGKSLLVWLSDKGRKIASKEFSAITS